MREYGLISTKMWTRGSGKRLRGNAVAIAVACYLCSAPESNLIGVYYCPLPTMAHELGFTVEEVTRALEAVELAGFAFYDHASEFVWVPNHAEMEIGPSLRQFDKRRKRIEAELRSIGHHRFVEAFRERYGEAYQLAPSMGHPHAQEGASKGHPSENANVSISGSDHDHDQDRALGGGGAANDSNPASERRPSRPPPPDPFGATFLAEAWREGVSLATGLPCTPLKPYERSDLAGFVSVHSGGLSGDALNAWVRDTAKAFVEASDAKFGFTPKRCAGWLDSGRPGKRDAKQESSLQKTGGDEHWRKNIVVSDL